MKSWPELIAVRKKILVVLSPSLFDGRQIEITEFIEFSKSPNLRGVV